MKVGSWFGHGGSNARSRISEARSRNHGGHARHGKAGRVAQQEPKSAHWQLQRDGNVWRGCGAGRKGLGCADVLGAAGSANLDGKLVMDACNPIADAPPVNGVLRFFTTLDQSLMEQLQTEFPAAHFVKAFNSVGAPRMVNPEYKDGRPTMFICGNDDNAKAATSKFLDQFGWEIADMGNVEAARAIEPLCMLWCILGFAKNEWTHAFKLLHQ